MGYEAKLVRSFSRIELQKLGFAFVAGFFVFSLLFLAVFRPYTNHSRILSLRLTRSSGVPSVAMVEDTTSSLKLDVDSDNTTEENEQECDASLCEKLRVNSTVLLVPPPQEHGANNTQQLERRNKTTQESDLLCDPKSGPCKVEGGAAIHENSLQLGTGSQNKTQDSELLCDPKSGLCQIDDDTVMHDNSLESAKSEDSMPKQHRPLCDVSERRVDVCEMDGDVRILGKSSVVLFVTSPASMGVNSVADESWRVRPYARKGDLTAMLRVREVSVKSLAGSQDEEAPPCAVNHSVPAVVFSISGYAGNLFHDFTDVLIPLFLTSHQFNGEVQFLVTDFNPWWIQKYKLVLEQLSRYQIINFDKEDRVHCFPHAIVGLKCHKELSIDPSKPPKGYSMADFAKFMRTAFSLERDTAIRIGEDPAKKPRLLIISRKRTRSFTNVRNIVRGARKLGYEVVVGEASLSSDVASFAKIVNSCDVLMGVHGAGLTNLVFLPTNATLIQIVPWGGLEWISRFDFGEPAVDMKLRYLQYTIKEEESSLIEQYPRDHPVFKDPFSFHKHGWSGLRAVFLDKQNVKLDVKRFSPVLLEALKLLHQ